MEDKRLEKMKEIYRHDFAHVESDTPSNIAIPLMALRGLAEMTIELAEMIEGQKQDLDNAIEQANQQMENIKFPNSHGSRCDTYLI